MRKTFVAIFIIASAAGYGPSSAGQTEGMLRYLKGKILDKPELSYDYVLFHNGAGTDTIRGRLTVGKDFIRDSNSQQLIIRNNDWLFQVDHNNKTIIIADLSQLKREAEKESLIMQKTHALSIADSLVLRYGKISVPVNTAETMTIRMEFSDEIYLKNFDIDYDKTTEALEEVRIVSDKLYRVDEDTYDEEYIRQTVIGKNFSYTINRELGNMERFFVARNGQISLKMFKGYKLISIKK